jgi:flagellar hook-associated protein 2
MATVSFSGLGSGIDFSSIRDAILAQKSVPITQMQTKVSTYNNRISGLRQLNTLLATLTTASDALTNRDLGNGRAGTVGDDTIAGATASGSAALGTFDLNVSRLATSFMQSSGVYSSASDPVLADGADLATFELRKGGAATGVPITIDSSNNTLAGLRDAINGANAGVTATIVDITGDGTQQKLVLSSNDTGASGRVELAETSDTGTSAALGLTSINPPDNDFSKLDAAFTINGLALTRPTNSFSDAVSGVALDLKKAGHTTVTIGQSSDVETKLTDFITAYNAIQDFVATQYTKNSNGVPSGVLAGDPTLRAVQQQMRGALNVISTDNGGTLTTLSDIGISSTEDGHLTLDTDTLHSKLQNNSADVRALLFGATSTQNGIFENFHTVLNNMSDAASGSVQTAITGYQSTISNLNDSIANKQDAIARLKQTLTTQFAAVDAAIGQLNSQGTALTSVMTALNKNSN